MSGATEALNWRLRISIRGSRVRGISAFATLGYGWHRCISDFRFGAEVFKHQNERVLASRLKILASAGSASRT